MDSTAVIVVIVWVAMLLIGIAASVRKARKKMLEQSSAPTGKMQGQPRPSWPQVRYDTTGPEIKRKRKVAAEGSLENIQDESPVKAASAGSKENVDPQKSGTGTDFDPEKMIIYSEIMKPGYEKY